MIFPISGVETSPLVPPLVAFCISFFTSMGGISGAFLLLPFQMSVLGFTGPAVSSTNMVYNVMATPAGVYRYFQENRMIWPLVITVVIGTFPGVIIGALLRIFLMPDPKVFKFFVGLVLIYIGGRLFYDIIKSGFFNNEKINRDSHSNSESEKAKKNSGDLSDKTVSVTSSSLSKVSFTFQGKNFSFSPILVFLLSLFVGVIGGAYGIGGGAILAPIFVTIFGLPIYTIAGATLAGTFMTSVYGVIFYQVLAPFLKTSQITVAPDWLLGFFFGIGGLAGIYLGARVQKFVPSNAIKIILGLAIMFVAVKYVVQYFAV